LTSIQKKAFPANLAFRDSSPKHEDVVINVVIPNLYEFLSSVEHKRKYFEEC